MLTNGGEFGAFVVARAIGLAILYATSSVIFGTLYAQIYRSGGAPAMVAVSLAVGLVSWLITFALFVSLRAGFGSVPPMMAANRKALTTSGGEIGAFLIAYVAIMAFGSVLTRWVISGITSWMRANGHANLIVVVSLGSSAVIALIFFAIFVGLRSAIAGPSAASGAYPPPPR
jgi:hypothetical protein